MSRPVRIGFVQMAMTDSRTENVRKASSLVADAASQGARVVVLPELFADRYFPQKMEQARYELAEPVGGELTAALREMARANGVTLVGGLYERAREGLLYNTALCIGPDGEVLGRYRKVHIPHGPGYEEKFYFAPGDLGFTVADAPDLRVGLAICWDQWFPETGRALGLGGAELIVFPTAIGDEPTEPGFSSLEAWQTACRAQALFNQTFVAAVNRIGGEEVLTFYGGSFICDPWGRVLVEAGKEEGAFVAGCDLDLIRETRGLFQFYRDRRPETYGPLVGPV
ncbi:MAG: carbon-nitrogen hydrolase [Actinobacteria bacterium]|nr:carbon-nitrogen hydrolase [Actinomycetota bacterium]